MLICIITGVVFAATIPAWYLVRNSGLKPDYMTGNGLEVVQGKKNKCLRADTESWTDETIKFWVAYYKLECVKKAIREGILVCRDEEKLSDFGKAFRGYSTGKAIVVGWNGKPEYTKSLFIHELSHHILYFCEVPMSEKQHHEVFKTKGLGH
jgi:hypothetical protein